MSNQSKDKGKTVSLEIEFAGIKFRSPVGVAAVGYPCGEGITPEIHADGLLKHADAGASFICTPGHQYATDETIAKIKDKAVKEDFPPYERNQMRWLKAGTGKGLSGIEGAYFMLTPFMLNYEYDRKRNAHTEKVIELLGKNKPKGVRLIANASGYGNFIETYVDAAKRAERLGADLIELNDSCPMPLTSRGALDYYTSRKYPLRMLGTAVGDHADIIAEITRAVAKEINIPLGWKLAPETGLNRIVPMAKGIRDAGGVFISTLNGALGISPPDIYNRGKPLWPFSDSNPFVLISGPWLRRDNYKFVAGIAKYVPGLDIMAAGGIFTPEHSVEAMMLGAKLVGLCTGVVYRGRRFIRQTNSFFNSFALEQGYEKIADIVGLGQQYIRPIEEVNINAGKTLVKLDTDKCTGCGICIDLCHAFSPYSGVVKLEEEKCAGCGGCVMVCPANALELVLK